MTTNWWWTAGSARRFVAVRCCDLTAQDCLRAVARHVKADGRADVRDLFDGPNLKDVTEVSPDAAMLVGGFEVVKRNLTTGDGQVDTIIKVKRADQSKYVEMGMKRFGLLIDRMQVSGDDELIARLASARKRVGG